MHSPVSNRGIQSVSGLIPTGLPDRFRSGDSRACFSFAHRRPPRNACGIRRWTGCTTGSRSPSVRVFFSLSFCDAWISLPVLKDYEKTSSLLRSVGGGGETSDSRIACSIPARDREFPQDRPANVRQQLLAKLPVPRMSRHLSGATDSVPGTYTLRGYIVKGR